MAQENSRKRLRAAFACYAGLAVLAGFTLDGAMRLFVWFLLVVLALKSWIAVRREELENR